MDMSVSVVKATLLCLDVEVFSGVDLIPVEDSCKGYFSLGFIESEGN